MRRFVVEPSVNHARLSDEPFIASLDDDGDWLDSAARRARAGGPLGGIIVAPAEPECEGCAAILARCANRRAA